MKLYLGLDGGQSSTTVFIGDAEGRVIGTGQAGPVDHIGTPEGLQRFVQAVGESVAGAELHAGLRDVHYEAACCGISGGPVGKELLIREMVRASQYFVTHDAWAAHSGALAGKPGVLVIAGTGSIAFGKDAQGKTARAGGWGYIFGDEGGAFDLVRQALRAVLRHEEGWGPQTQLREALLGATAAPDANDLLHRFYTADYPRDRVASYASLLGECAQRGDAVAHELMMTAAHTLALLAASVRRSLFPQLTPVTVSYAGGVFTSAPILERFRLLVELEEGNQVAAPQFGPTAGALIEAYRLGGVECTLKDVPEQS